MKNSSVDYRSPYYKCAGKTLNWLSQDTEELFLENIKNKKQELIDNNWLPFQKIDYKFNSSGFRCNEFDIDSNSIMFLGCSYTVGIGMHLKDTFSAIVSKQLNLENVNLGVAGSSSNTAFRLGSYWIPILKPKIVIYLESSKERFEIVAWNAAINLLPNYTPVDLKIFYEHYWLQDETNSYLNSLKNKLALEFICQKLNIKFLYLDLWKIANPIDCARDLAHFGIKSHVDLSDKLLRILENDNRILER